MEKISFKFFLEKFPEHGLPVTLRTDTYEILGNGIEPLPTLLIEQYLLEDDEEDDGMTEYLACFRLPLHANYEAVVYWKAGLLSYEYHLKTYTKDGVGVIDSHVIGGTVVIGDKMVESVATIQEDRIICIATGATQVETMEFDTANNKILYVEINEDGTIIAS
jgi:hypothetical protein